MITCTRDDWLNALMSSQSKLVIERFGLTRVSSRCELCDRVIPEHYLTMVVDETNDRQNEQELRLTEDMLVLPNASPSSSGTTCV